MFEGAGAVTVAPPPGGGCGGDFGFDINRNFDAATGHFLRRRLSGYILFVVFHPEVL